MADALPYDVRRHADAIECLDGVRQNPTIVNLLMAHRRLDVLASAIPHVNVRMATLASFTIDPLTAPIQVAALAAGIRLETWNSPFGQVIPTLVDPGVGLDAFAPDIVLVATRLADVVPQLYDGVLDGVPTAVTAVADWLDQLDAALMSFRQRSRATLLLQTFERPTFLVSGLAEAFTPGSQLDIWRTANERLQQIADRVGKCNLVDYDALVSRHGSRTWIDPRTERYGRIPIAAHHYWDYARFIVRHLRPLVGRTKKVIVLDADNTLWGGILGDDGPNGIKLGHDFPGNAFVAFQRRLLGLQRRGVVLCIASKNEPGSVESVVSTHPEMVLRPEHFACMRVSWSPKPDAIREIGRILNLGLDSFVFIDDSAVECAMMRETLPEVEIVQLPEDPARYSDVIESLDCFDQYTLSSEDRQRSAMYKAEADRRQLAETTVDLPSFYRGLRMTLTFGVDDERQIARAAQMTQRTNQFNMNTIRCTEDDIRRSMAAADEEVITLSLSDRFGDSGVVGLAIIHKQPDIWGLPMLLMSCRVLGRTVESTLIAWIAQRALAAGAKELRASFEPTAKNQPFADFYRKCGFAPASADSPARLWVLKLDQADTTIPDWITVRQDAPTD